MKSRLTPIKLSPVARQALRETSKQYEFDPGDFLSYILESMDDEQWDEQATTYLAEIEDSNDDEDDAGDEQEKEEIDDLPEKEE